MRKGHSSRETWSEGSEGRGHEEGCMQCRESARERVLSDVGSTGKRLQEKCRDVWCDGNEERVEEKGHGKRDM